MNYFVIKNFILYKQIILNSNQFVLQKIRCYHFAQLNLEEFTLGKTSGGGVVAWTLAPQSSTLPPHAWSDIFRNYNYLQLQMLSIKFNISLNHNFSHKDVQTKGPPLKSQGLYFYIKDTFN